MDALYPIFRGKYINIKEVCKIVTPFCNITQSRAGRGVLTINAIGCGAR